MHTETPDEEPRDSAASHLGKGEEALLHLADALIAAGEEGIDGLEWSRENGFNDRDKDAGWLAHSLRLGGFLVQRTGSRLFILREAKCIKGNWMRHDTLGLVFVKFEAPGFPAVSVARLGRVGEERIKVLRTELKGV